MQSVGLPNVIPRSELPTPHSVVSGRRDSNPRRSPWKGDALPLSYSRVPSGEFRVWNVDCRASAAQFPIPNAQLRTQKRWAGEDLNLRRQSRQIYSLVRLTKLRYRPRQRPERSRLSHAGSILRLSFKTYDDEKLPGRGSNFK